MFKKGSKTDPKHYRPYSLLPLLSKLIEKAIHIQTQEYLDRHGLLYKFQSGFRKKFSTDSCLVQLSDFIINGMDKGLHTGMILIDLQKASDTLDHDILLEKMECLDLKNLLLNGLNHIFQIEIFLYYLKEFFQKKNYRHVEFDKVPF